MIEYKTRYRASRPRLGDKVWIEGKVPDEPLRQGNNGTIIFINWAEREVIVLLDSKQVTYDMSDFNGKWCDATNSYLMEEPDSGHNIEGNPDKFNGNS